MAVEKICPLTFDRKDPDFSYCAEQRCAWWVDDTISGRTSICSISLLALRLDEIAHFKRAEVK